MPNDSADNLNYGIEDIEVELGHDQDAVMEQILENVSNTPIGKVLKRIASLPEVRREKVLKVRRQLSDGSYDLNDRLNSAIDKVLEDVLF